jgi:radical SAM superfamily enzyme YgiQ (UPF0313 family)
MKIALIFPPYTHKIFSENLSTVDEEFCVAPPIILAYVAAIMEQHGHEVRLIDTRALNLSREEVLNELKAFKPNLLGFRAETYHFHDALEWMGYLKKNLGIPVISGGINLSLYPKETMSHPEVDYGIMGEAINTLPRFISALENEEDLRGIPGIAYKKDGALIVNPLLNDAVDFNSYPFPARHLLKNDAYYSFVSQLKNFTVMLTSTGCPFRCSFCAIHRNTKYRTRHPENVVAEIELCYRDFNIREIDFFDATFFVNKDRVLRIFDEMRRRGIRIEWSCRSRVDVVDKDILRKAADAGCRQIYYGIESVDHNVLKAIKKDVGLEQMKDAIKWSKKYGIRSMGFFMVGNKGDTKESIRNTIEFSKDLGLDFIQVCRTIAKPGTELNDFVIEKTGRDYWREYISGRKIEGRIPMPWSDLSELDIESLTKEFYIKFYFRPRILWDRIRQLRSLNEILRYVKVGWKMLLQKSEAYSHVLTDTSQAEKVLLESARYLQEARKKSVAIVIPTYNEKDNIEAFVSSIADILPAAHIVIVDDNSPDGTGLIIDKLCRQNKNIHVMHRNDKRGLGLAYKDGFRFIIENLDSEYIFEIDADFSHNPQYIPIFLHYVDDYGLVTGSRFLNHVSIKNRTLFRNIISKTTKYAVNKLIRMDLTDVSTGFKCFRREALEAINLDKIRSVGYAFQIEMSFFVQSKGFSI